MVTKDFDVINNSPLRAELWATHLSVFKSNMYRMHTTIETFQTLQKGVVVWAARIWRDDLAAWRGYGETPELATKDAFYRINRDNS